MYWEDAAGPQHRATVFSASKGSSKKWGAQLVDVAGITPINSQKLADMYNVTAYTNLQEMLDRKELDVVNICTPSGNHREHACAAMRSGRHVIVEKPMEITLPVVDGYAARHPVEIILGIYQSARTHQEVTFL